MGSGRMMGFIDNVAPSSVEMKPEPSENGEEMPHKADDPTVLFVFKTLVEPNLGKMSFFKVISGSIEVGKDLVNHHTLQSERLNQLFIMDGKNRNPVEKLVVGDIGATLKLKDTETNHTLKDKSIADAVKPIQFPGARIRTAIIAKNKHDDEKLSEVLKKIHQEDPTVTIEYSREVKQLILSCQGELHLAMVKWTLKNTYNLDVEFITPKIPYRETIRKPSDASYRHKKQSGGAGQFGEVYLKIEPYHEGMDEPTGFNIRNKDETVLPWGGKLVFYNCIVGGVIDLRFLPSIRKGILEKMEEGPLTGSYVRDVRVMVYDGKMHAVDSNDISFKIAGMMAFKQAFTNADPQLLEPINDLEVVVPEELMGEVMTDLQGRRSIIQGMEARGAYQVIKAKTPLAELDRYTTSLRSITQGRANFSTAFSEYAPVPYEIQQKLMEAYNNQVEAVHS